MRRTRTIAAIVSLAGAAGALWAANPVEWSDPVGDAAIRRTDTGNNGPIDPTATLPDLALVRIGAWDSATPTTDPYSGSFVPPETAHLVRIDLFFAGVVCPPGSLGLSGGPFDPQDYGKSPLYGFLEIDVDEDSDTGGELGGAANLRYLANVARFGRLPTGPMSARAAQSGKHLDLDFGSAPHIERSGADFSLVLCGCGQVTVVSEGGNQNGAFDAGETWIVRGRFLERSRGFQDASAAFGGSDFGLYDPFVSLRFRHDTVSNRTIVTLVHPLDMAGASMLTGEPEQALDLDVENHASIVEALDDIIVGAPFTSGDAYAIVGGWEGDDAFGFLDPTRWRVSALFGTSYTTVQDTLYVWTDTGVTEAHGDVDGNGVADASDESLIRAHVYVNDAGMCDADGIRNGRVVTPNPGPGFNVFDLDGNHIVQNVDTKFYGPLADQNQSATIDTDDLIQFLADFAYGYISADFDMNARVDTDDFVAFLSAFAQGL